MGSDLAPKADVDDREDGLRQKAKEAAPGSERPRRKDLGLGVDRPRKAGSAAKQDQKVDVAPRVDVERQASANVSSKQKAITSVGEDGKRGMQLVQWGI